MLSRNTVVSLRCARGTSKPCVRNLSARASAILGALEIPFATEVPGVYDGRWGGSGDILESVCPTTGEVLARVQSVRPLSFHYRRRRADSRVGITIRAARSPGQGQRSTCISQEVTRSAAWRCAETAPRSARGQGETRQLLYTLLLIGRALPLAGCTRCTRIPRDG